MMGMQFPQREASPKPVHKTRRGSDLRTTILAKSPTYKPTYEKGVENMKQVGRNGTVSDSKWLGPGVLRLLGEFQILLLEPAEAAVELDVGTVQLHLPQRQHIDMVVRAGIILQPAAPRR